MWRVGLVSFPRGLTLCFNELRSALSSVAVPWLGERVYMWLALWTVIEYTYSFLGTCLDKYYAWEEGKSIGDLDYSNFKVFFFIRETVVEDYEHTVTLNERNETLLDNC